VPYAVLAHRGDTDAKLLAEELERRASAPEVELVWADELLLDSRFTHRVDEAGVETEIACAGRRRLDSHELFGAACRLRHSLPPQFAGAPDTDREYAAMESYALLLSWLTSLDCPLVNPPSPGGLSGPVLGLLEWLALARASGLRSRRLQLAAPGAQPPPAEWQAVTGSLAASSTATFGVPPPEIPGEGQELWLEPVEGPAREALVVGERVFGEVTDEEATACVELARRAACPVLGVHLAAPTADGGETSVFCGAQTLPNLGREGAVAVAELLTGETA